MNTNTATDAAATANRPPMSHGLSKIELEGAEFDDEDVEVDEVVTP